MLVSPKSSSEFGKGLLVFVLSAMVGQDGLICSKARHDAKQAHVPPQLPPLCAAICHCQRICKALFRSDSLSPACKSGRINDNFFVQSLF